MCKHILNAQVQIRAPCCKSWFDCSKCHEEVADHKLAKHFEMVFACKKCKKVFRKDTSDFDKTDEFCPRCDNHFVLPAKTKDSEFSYQEPKIDFRKDNSFLVDQRVRQPTLEEQLKDFDFTSLLD